MRPRTVPSLLLLLLIGVLVAAPGCNKKDDKGKPSADKSPSPGATEEGGKPAAAFKATLVEAVDGADRPQATEKAKQVAPQIVEFVNSYYAIAFVDPAKWGDGQHPELAGLFAPDVQGQVGGQLQGLALGDIAPKLTSVAPGVQEVAITVFVNGDDLATPFIAVTTQFQATGEAKTKEDGPVKIVHVLNAFLVPDGGSYKFTGGGAELHADTEAQAVGPVDRAVTFGAPQ
jgi:hypothetical protein